MVPTTPGSGITLYAAHDHDNINVNITLDGNSSTVTTKAIPPDPSQKESYNVAIYDIQSLPFGDHNVTVRNLPWAVDGTNQLWFDYAIVNDTNTSSANDQ